METAKVVPAVCHTVSVLTHLLRLNLKFHLTMANKILLHILIGN
jgi:hypothetical protein